MKTKYLVIPIVAAAVMGILVTATLSTQAFSANQKPRDPNPDADVVVRDYNMPAMSQFSISLDKSDLSLAKGDSRGHVVKVTIESQDGRPLDVNLEFRKPAQDGGQQSARLEGIRHAFDAQTVRLEANGKATVALTIAAEAGANLGSQQGEVFAYVLDGTIEGVKDPNRGLNVYTGHGLPLNLTVTE